MSAISPGGTVAVTINGRPVIVPTGRFGASAYQLAVQQGFTGTLDEWIESLAGTDGTDGRDGATVHWRGPWQLTATYITNDPDDETSLADAVGHDGSAYVCVQNHVAASLNEPGVGADWQTYWTQIGAVGEPGPSAYDVAVTEGYAGTQSEFVDGLTRWLPFFPDDDETLVAQSAERIPTQRAVVEYVMARLAELIGGAPTALNALNELADALGNDPNFAASMAAALGGKQSQSAILDAFVALAASNDDFLQRKAGAWAARTIAQVQADLGISTGWIAETGWSWNSGPTSKVGVINVPTGAETRMQPGDLVMLTQTLGAGQLFGVIVAIPSTTTIAVYFGTDYQGFGNFAITAPFISHARSPLGFPRDPAKWTETLVNDTTTIQKSNPSVFLIYHSDFGALTGTLPIGSWQLKFSAALEAECTASTIADGGVDVSTSSSALGSGELRLLARDAGASGAHTARVGATALEDRTVTVPTPLFVLGFTSSASITALRLQGTAMPTRLKARCALL